MNSDKPHKPKHGGARPGSGPPKKLADGKRINVFLDTPSIATATKAGDGNVSKGIRTALKAWEQRKDDDEQATD